ncbi:MAG: PaaI family thioesterase [Candidatus Eremiobacteraeota bacterium]|nr:PaaI family thioesterase [Candidatus Eremiobacteraeota bacterium]
MRSSEAAEHRLTIAWSDPIPALEAAKALSGMEYIEAMATGKFAMSPMAQLVSLRIEKVEHSKVLLAATPADFHYNSVGTVHGGFAATVIDFATGFATATLCRVGYGWTTIELKVNYVRPITSSTGAVACSGEIVHPGSKIVTSQARLMNEDAKLLAHGTATCLLLPWPQQSHD